MRFAARPNEVVVEGKHCPGASLASEHAAARLVARPHFLRLLSGTGEHLGDGSPKGTYVVRFDEDVVRLCDDRRRT